MKAMSKLIVSFVLLWSFQSFSQSVTMEFPAFAGKTYEFIIFQGSKAEKIIQDTIPKNGKFVLKIPKQYAPYTGMSRWLLTNSESGGGIDMAIPGHDFSISCLSEKPDNTNIVYKGFDAVNELNRLNSEQQLIIDKFETMRKALQLYDTTHPLYAAFQKEKAMQIEAYGQFQEDLKKNTNYNARFLPIVNLVNGHSHRLTDNEDENALLFNEFFTKKMSIEDLYVSGHWDGIIQSWVVLQMNVIKDENMFVKDFKLLSDRIIKPKQYTDLVGKMTFYLTQYGKDEYIEAIAPTVLESKKVIEYSGSMQVYLKALVGMQAPDLVITEHIGKVEDHNHRTTILKSSDFAQHDMNKTLLIFYQSGCGPCEELLQKLPSHYETLKSKRIDIIAISADEGENLFRNTSRDFPWSRTYCDFKGKEGLNFKNYAVTGTPMIYLIDKAGKIELKSASLDFLQTVDRQQKVD